jgi:hypothetical protein
MDDHGPGQGWIMPPRAPNAAVGLERRGGAPLRGGGETLLEPWEGVASLDRWPWSRKSRHRASRSDRDRRRANDDGGSGVY